MKQVQFSNTDLPDIIELRGIQQKYDTKDGEITVIDGLDLLIENKPNQGQFVVILGTSGCVDCETEFFCGSSWKRISEWDNDKVLQYNENGTASLVVPDEYIVLPESELNFIQTKYGVNQCFCDEHTIIYQSRKTGKLLSITGGDLVKRHKEKKFGFQGRFLTTFQYSGTGVEMSDNEIRLMVAVIADGYFRSNTNYCAVNIKKRRKIDRLKNLLESCNIEYNVVNRDKYEKFFFYAPRREKEFGEFWYSCNNHQLGIIVEESLKWDGNIKDGIVTTTVKATADFFQFAASSTGIRSTINTTDRTDQKYIKNGKEYERKSKEYRVIFSNNKTVGISGNTQVEIQRKQTIDGKKYCFRVPSGMLVLRRGDRIFITGNCGKSTVLRYIAGLQKPTKGKVKIKGQPLQLRNPVSMVFQQYSSFPWYTILQNVALGLKYRGVPKEDREEQAKQMLKLVGLSGQEKKYTANLSGGQLQRVAIARCLVTNPEILLMDEPFGALDISTRLSMQNLLARLWLKIEGDLTVVFVTHDIPEAVYLADEIWMMRSHPGQIVEKIKVPFPLERDKDLKRSPEFTRMVYDIEDRLNEIETVSVKARKADVSSYYPPGISYRGESKSPVEARLAKVTGNE